MNDLFEWGGGYTPTNKIHCSNMSRIVEQSKSPCSCCGVSSALNPHRIDKQKTRLLRDMAMIHATGVKWIRVEQGRGLRGDDGVWKSTSYCASAHVTRLSWFGLAETKGHRTCKWRLTENGFLFLNSQLSVPQRILCRGGEVVYESIEEINISDVNEEFDKEYWDNYPWSDFVDQKVLL